MVAVRYVGKKPTAIDNVAGSGKTWNGKDDVQEVTEAQARRLIKHPDQWQLVDESDAAAVGKAPVVTVTDEDGKPADVDEDGLKKPLEKMNKAELIAYAKVRYNKELAPTLGKKAMIDQIEDLAKDLDALGL